MFYRELSILESEDVSVPVVANYIMRQVHSFIANGRQVFASFPRIHEKGLGDIIRLHGSADDLQAWDHSLLTSFASLSPVLSVPAGHDMRVFRRYRPRGKAHYRRALKKVLRDRPDDSKAIRDLTEKMERGAQCDLPYFIVKSTSTGEKFSLFVQEVSFENASDDALCYGLGMPVPVF